MTFVDTFNQLPLERFLHSSMQASREEIDQSLNSSNLDLNDYARLISPAAADYLEPMAHHAQSVTQRRFGKVIRLFAPLYLSNECINNCSYCGFSRDNHILRVTLSIDEVVSEARELTSQGFRNLLVVAGEHPKFVSECYLQDCITALHEFAPGIDLEVGPMETSQYQSLVAMGAEGLVAYQETYDRPVYAEMHTAGPKKNFNWRLSTPERAYAAGFRRLGIGALLGLGNWRWEALCVAAHAQWLLKHCWKAQITVSLPRLRPCAGEFESLVNVSDKDFVQLICALRLLLPDVGIVLSTRESTQLRDGLFPLGITHASAGSHTEPGGYADSIKNRLHSTKRNPHGELTAVQRERATGQFDIADERNPAAVARVIRKMGYEPVWKDWDVALTGQGDAPRVVSLP